jgi:hypothetical protein
MKLKRLKKYIFVIIFTTFSVYGTVFAENLKLNFNGVANNFHILDQISESLPDFFIMPEYKAEFKGKFDDEKILSKYRSIRKKYQTIPKAFQHNTNSEDLFAPNPDELNDPIFDAFFTSYTISDALNKLKTLLTKDEIIFLANLFDKYNPVFEKINQENKHGIKYNLDLLNSNMDDAKITLHMNHIRAFYQSPNKSLKSVLLLWSPSTTGFGGQAYGEHLIIRTSSKKIPDEETAKMLVSVIVHEATHHISANAPYNQKRKLSKVFLSKSNIDTLPHYLFAIEEPLVMATQMLFVETNYPEIYAKNQDWFNHPMAIKIFPIVKDYISGKKSLDNVFIENFAILFNEINSG